ncbi:MAG: hypothetical protein ACREUU_09735 [Gammaproteobacteria bacterium]
MPKTKNDIPCVPSYARKTLPAPGTPGCLARVTDGARGLWMDQGSQWFSLIYNGTPTAAIVKASGGDPGVTVPAKSAYLLLHDGSAIVRVA